MNRVSQSRDPGAKDNDVCFAVEHQHHPQALRTDRGVTPFLDVSARRGIGGNDAQLHRMVYQLLMRDRRRARYPSPNLERPIRLRRDVRALCRPPIPIALEKIGLPRQRHQRCHVTGPDFCRVQSKIERGQINRRIFDDDARFDTRKKPLPCGPFEVGSGKRFGVRVV